MGMFVFFICRISDLFVKRKLSALKGIWGPSLSPSTLLPTPHACRRADIKPKTGEGEAKAGGWKP